MDEAAAAIKRAQELMNRQLESAWDQLLDGLALHPRRI
jgi:hypothetical protein